MCLPGACDSTLAARHVAKERWKRMSRAGLWLVGHAASGEREDRQGHTAVASAGSSRSEACLEPLARPGWSSHSLQHILRSRKANLSFSRVKE